MPMKVTTGPHSYFSSKPVTLGLALIIAATALFVLYFSDSSTHSKTAGDRDERTKTDIVKRGGADSLDQPRFNASHELDFAVIGFPKTGTTFLLEVLGAHPEITMPPKEFCQIHRKDGDRQLMKWIKNQSLPNQKYGIKCPTMIRVTNAIENLMKVSDQTRLVVGVRHPVLWFQSFYNYRVYENYLYPELFKDSPIQSPFGLNSTHDWRSCSIVYGKYEIFLKQLAKVSVTGDEMQEMIKSDSLWEKRFSVNPYKVFIYTSDQLEDKNTTRQSRFGHDLKEFLRLDTPLIDFRSVPKVNANNETHDEYINICDPKFLKIRRRLLESGKKSSEWILQKFIKSRDVVVSNVDFFHENLKTWGVDPCLSM